MAEVRIRGVRKSYGSMEVIHGVDIDIPDGSFTALVGPSGCGKSTMIRMIAGLEEITDGVIAIGDRVVNNVPAKDRDIAMVFQSYALYPHMTVAENMGFALDLRRTPRAEIRRRVAEAAEILGLTEFLERRPKHLSGGQRQRVAMGRAIVRDPQVFLFDEPLSNLDAKLRVQMRAEIKTLHQRLNATTVFVTHDQVEAMTMSDQIVALDAGKVEQVGPPLELYDRPANLFVAGFIGSPSMNLIDGALAGDTVRLDGLTVPTPPLGASAPGEGRPVVYGVRPESLEIAEDGLPAEVLVIEPTGAETLVVFTTPIGEVSALFRERRALAPGEKLHLRPRRAETHLFDKESGRRL